MWTLEQSDEQDTFINIILRPKKVDFLFVLS